MSVKAIVCSLFAVGALSPAVMAWQPLPQNPVRTGVTNGTCTVSQNNGKFNGWIWITIGDLPRAGKRPARKCYETPCSIADVNSNRWKPSWYRNRRGEVITNCVPNTNPNRGAINGSLAFTPPPENPTPSCTYECDRNGGGQGSGASRREV